MEPMIRKATEVDAVKIIDRLKKEMGRSGEGFWHNRNLISESVSAGELTVITARGKIAGFLMHSDRSMDIMEIWPGYRRRGYGRLLARFGMQRIYSCGRLGINIHCQPKTSILFWKNLGFKPATHDRECEQFWHVQEMSFNLPIRKRKLVELRFYYAFFQNERTITLSSAQIGKQLQLKERVILRVDEGGICVDIKVDGVLVYDWEANQPEAQRLGVEYHWPFLRIDRLNVPTITRRLGRELLEQETR